MSSNGSHSQQPGQGKSRLAMRVSGLMDSSTFRESSAFVAAEGVSMIISLGVVGVIDLIAEKPLKTASKTLSKAVIEPYLDTIESVIGRFCKLKECQIDQTKSKEERAERLAHVSIVFTSAWAISMGFKMLTRHLLTRKIPEHDPTSPYYRPHPDDKRIMGMTKHEWKLWGADEGVHYGSLLLMNTGLSKVTDELIDSTSRILTKCGVPEKKAHELSSMAWIWEAPNLLGAAAGIGVISKYNNHNWGQKI